MGSYSNQYDTFGILGEYMYCVYQTLDRIVSVNKGLRENAQNNIAHAKIRLGLINKLLRTCPVGS
jgi:hypothetical protein